ncbi:MAG: RNA polymerase factor sigma-54 [Bacillota bacterium]|nr:RNA polymerase factor sigma-54 [Bacillota bacterium]
MNFDFELNLTQQQKLVMTQQMQLSIKVLQMSSYELKELVDREVQENPTIEAEYNESVDLLNENISYKDIIKNSEDNNRYDYNQVYSKEEEGVSPFNFIASKVTLKDYLNEQISELNVTDYTKSFCRYIVENINSKGYLDEDIAVISKQLGIKLAQGQQALAIVQSLEPDGIGARDIKECLKIQLIKRKLLNKYIEKIIDDYLDYIAENKYSLISKQLKITIKEAQEYGDVIKSLQPKPSRGFYTGEDTEYIIPDAHIRKIDNEYFILMNDGVIPKLTISDTYKNILNQEQDKAAVDYVKKKIDSAVLLMKSIEQRKGTLYRVLENIVKLQREYFDFGEIYLKPMTLKEVADNLDMHESTISRAIRDKYVGVDRGIVKIKDLFTVGISSKNSSDDVSIINIKNMISKMVEEEDKSKPLSDQAICDALNKEGMNISRRTVAKYREELGIRSSSKRKRF